MSTFSCFFCLLDCYKTCIFQRRYWMLRNCIWEKIHSLVSQSFCPPIAQHSDQCRCSSGVLFSFLRDCSCTLSQIPLTRDKLVVPHHSRVWLKSKLSIYYLILEDFFACLLAIQTQWVPPHETHPPTSPIFLSVEFELFGSRTCGLDTIEKGATFEVGGQGEVTMEPSVRFDFGTGTQLWSSYETKTIGLVLILIWLIDFDW